MVDKRKSVSKCIPIGIGGAGYLLLLTFCFHTFLGPELFVSPPMSTVQTMACLFDGSRSGSSLEQCVSLLYLDILHVCKSHSII